MYKVMLVDDEEFDLEGLRRLVPWTEVNMEVSASFNNPNAALQYASEFDVDVIVSDIKMPKMSGLELVAKIQERLTKVKVIFVSGHEDFHYAKKAIALNVNGYVLKPVDEDDLRGVLRQVSVDLDKELEQSGMESALKAVEPIVRSEYLLRWLDGTTDADGLVQLTERYGIDTGNKQRSVALIEIDDIAWKLNRFMEQERRNAVNEVMKEIYDYVVEKGLGLYCRPMEHQASVVLEEIDSVKLFTVMEELIGRIKAVSPLSITVGLGMQTEEPWSVSESYKQAKAALNYKMFAGKGKVIAKSQTPVEVQQNVKELEELLEPLFFAMANYELVRIDDCLTELFSRVKLMQQKVSVYNFALHLIAKLDAYMNKLNENMYRILGWEYKDLEVLFQFETMDDIISWMRRRLFQLSEHLHEKKRKKNYKLIQDIEQYIDINLEAELTLRDIANVFAFSPSYLGTMFKEQAGLSFSEYVIGKRLERAGLLLQNPKLKVYEIAERVGYKNIAHFSRQFKDRFGVTPGDYRK
jgi:two-component system, response regulator YesN